MPASIRPYVTAGVALVGASVISVTSIQPVTPQTRISNDAYSLTAATVPGAPGDPTGDGIACSGYHTDQCDINAPQSYTPIVVDTNDWAFQNVLPNLVNAIASVPRAYLDALNDEAWSLEVTGSWWVYTPTNVLGFDAADPPKITAITNLLIPFKALSNPLAEHLSWWAKANMPMNAGCTGTAPPTCQDANAILSKMYLAPIWDLIAGYTFPKLNNPVSAAEGAAGEEIPGSEGAPVPWSGVRIQINPYDPVWNVVNYFFADPQQNRPEPIKLSEVVDTFVRVAKGLWQDFYPFVPGSFLWKGYPYTLVTPLLKPFVRILCPSCDPEHPEDPTPFDGQLPPSSQDAPNVRTGPLVKLLNKLGAPGEHTTTDGTDGTTAASTLAAEQTPAAEDAPTGHNGDVVKTAVANLVKKFEAAPTKTTPAADDTEVKTDSGTPSEAKPGQTSAAEDTSSNDAAGVTDKAGPDGSGGQKTPKKWTLGGKHRKADDTTKGSDADAGGSTTKTADKSSDGKKSAAGASGAKSGAGASSNGSGGGSDSGGGE